MNVAIRVDASQEIGTGHVMRCLTVADGLAKQGAYIRFIVRHMPPHLAEMIKSKGFDCKQLNSLSARNQLDELKHANWLGTSQVKDAEESIAELADKKWDWLIIDHYALDFRWESILRNTTQKLMVIDDIADRKHDCDVLLDQNFYEDMDSRYAEKVPRHCQLMLGPKFALLREDFLEARKTIKVRTGIVKRVLIFFGGIDSENYTGKAIEALSGLSEYHFDVDVVIGAVNPNKDEIMKMCAAQGYLCHVQTRGMAELMANADLAIGAGGTAVWEKCSLGLPSVAIATAENQVKQLSDLATYGYCYLVDNKNNIIESIKLHTNALLDNTYLLTFISQNCLGLVDGLGVNRLISKIIIQKNIKIRQVSKQDEKDVYDWRNHPKIRAASRNKNIIEWNSHQSWFQQVLASENVLMLIAELDKTPIGVVRYDIKGEQAEISIYLIQQNESSGLGYAVLESSEQWIASNQPTLKQLNANVQVSNRASHHLFEKAFYQLESLNYTKVLQ